MNWSNTIIGMSLALSVPALAIAATAPSLSNTLHGLISYTKWPEASSTRTLCQVGYTKHSGALGLVGPQIKLRKIARTSHDFSGCHIIYLGQLSPQKIRSVTSKTMNQSVLTIEESRDGCVGRAMVCIRFSQSKHSFDLNLDSIARSGLRVDPRVLRLAREGQ
jgi:hypothetical protein